MLLEPELVGSSEANAETLRAPIHQIEHTMVALEERAGPQTAETQGAQGARSLALGDAAVAFQDLRRFARGPLKGRDRIAQHLVSSGAALIATTTAMLVTVGRWLPDAIPGFVWWLLPTVLVTPLLVRWSGQVQRGELRF